MMFSYDQNSFVFQLFTNVGISHFMKNILAEILDRRPIVQNNCKKLFPNQKANCTEIGDCFVLKNETWIQCASISYDFIPVTYDVSSICLKKLSRRGSIVLIFLRYIKIYNKI